ncbi:MAG: ribonuclease E activity regulator RraA [Alphaproteobacteria bacterium]|nr:ribonuclease E activity regulator RraA [Alphaproteobacteria bacterium]
MIPVCDLCDAHPDTVQVFEPVFHSFGGRDAFFGQAETIRTHEDNSRVREAVSEPGEGRVLVVDGGGSLKRSLLGGDLAGKAAKNGWAGVIVHGAVRDVAELEAEDIGVFALALIPMKTEKRGLGERGVTVALPGAVIHPGDWIYADRDGVVAAREALHDV